MPALFTSAHQPKTMTVESIADGRVRVVITLKKLGQDTMLEYFLDAAEAKALGQALSQVAA